MQNILPTKNLKISELSWYFASIYFSQLGFTCFLHDLPSYTSILDTSTEVSGDRTRTIRLIMYNYPLNSILVDCIK